MPSAQETRENSGCGGRSLEGPERLTLGTGCFLTVAVEAHKEKRCHGLQDTSLSLGTGRAFG